MQSLRKDISGDAILAEGDANGHAIPAKGHANGDAILAEGDANRDAILAEGHANGHAIPEEVHGRRKVCVTDEEDLPPYLHVPVRISPGGCSYSGLNAGRHHLGILFCPEEIFPRP